ncbi:hypothetical protein BDW71DRAFT_26778 [Aspergillus fruticulosus]
MDSSAVPILSSHHRLISLPRLSIRLRGPERELEPERGTTKLSMLTTQLTSIVEDQTPYLTTRLTPHITVQMQKSHSVSPQSQPKQGFETVLMGLVIEEPELEPEEGRVQLRGVAMEGILLCVLCVLWRARRQGSGFSSAYTASSERTAEWDGR